MKKLITTAAIALISAALLHTSANASNPITQGDLILGFQQPGDSENIEADLGASSLFTALENTGTTVNLTFGSNTSGFGAFDSADLSLLGGSGNIYFAVTGSPGIGSGEVFATDANDAAEPAIGTGPVNKVSGETNPYHNAAATGHGTDIKIAPGTTGSFQNEAGAGSLATYANGLAPTEGIVPTSTGTVALDLYDITAAGQTEVGTFDLSFGASQDTLTFTGTPLVETPEPSTYALFGFSALALILSVRRRNKLQA